jgi:phage shock protein E
MRSMRLISLLALVSAIFSSASALAEAVILDVRTPKEYERSHVKGAINVDIKSDGFENEIEKLDHSADYVVYCKSGKRSTKAAEQMKAAGFTSVRNLGSARDASKHLNVPCEGKHKRCL